uniref:Uncharacterized protein n=1 Tax=Streptomyces sp. NBC_00049 TaxID=2903617 RepID=A0AAU2JMW1_9ACTN
MEQAGTDQILASKWDLPFVVFSVLRVVFGSLPLWTKATIFGILCSAIAWAAITRLRGRRGRAT